MRKNGARCLAACGLVLAASGCAAKLSLADLPGSRLWRSSGPSPATLEATPSEEIPSPEGLRAESGQPRSVPLQWDPLLGGDVAGYVIERAPARDGTFARLGSVADRFATIYIDRSDGTRSDSGASAIEDGATYFYRVRSYTPDGRISDPKFAKVVEAKTAKAPAAPKGLRAWSNQPRRVPLKWDASEDAAAVGYVVYRSPSKSGDFEPIAQLDGRYTTVYTDPGLGALRVFYYRVAARNAFGAEGPRSTDDVWATTKPEPLPPIDLRVVEQRLGANRLAWEPNVEADISEYRLLRGREGADPSELVTSVPPGDTTAEDVSVASGERVAYALVAVDSDGLQSDPSKRTNVACEGYGLSARAESDGIHLRWNPRSEEGFHGARVLRTRWLTSQELAFVQSDSYVDGEAKPGVRYRYEVILERPDGSRAPASIPVEVELPKR